jgi:hypothetical protein
MALLTLCRQPLGVNFLRARGLLGALVLGDLLTGFLRLGFAFIYSARITGKLI